MNYENCNKKKKMGVARLARLMYHAAYTFYF